MSTRPGAPLLAPWSLAAIALLVVNDHWWKGHAPGLVSGKLSDVAGLLFFPLFVEALLSIPKGRTREGTRTLLLSTLATCVVFALVKTVPVCGEAYRVGLGALQWPARAALALAHREALPRLVPVRLWQDRTDLVALPFAFVALALRRRALARDARAAKVDSPRAAAQCFAKTSP